MYSSLYAYSKSLMYVPKFVESLYYYIESRNSSLVDIPNLSGSNYNSRYINILKSIFRESSLSVMCKDILVKQFVLLCTNKITLTDNYEIEYNMQLALKVAGLCSVDEALMGLIIASKINSSYVSSEVNMQPSYLVLIDRLPNNYSTIVNIYHAIGRGTIVDKSVVKSVLEEERLVNKLIKRLE